MRELFSSIDSASGERAELVLNRLPATESDWWDSQSGQLPASGTDRKLPGSRRQPLDITPLRETPGWHSTDVNS